MAEEGNWKIQHSFKFGFNSLDMVNVRAETFDEFVDLMDKLSTNAAIIGGATADFKAAHAVGDAFPGAETVPFEGGQPVQPAAPAQGQRICSHGRPYEFRSGNKNGKAWAGWFCQVENDPSLPKCKAIWQN